MSRKPVLILISSETCPACKHFAPEWEELKNRLHGSFRMVSFRLKPGMSAPPTIDTYAPFYPSIILATADEYNRFFTDDDRPVTHSGVMKAKRYNAIFENGQWIPARKPNSADAISLWAKQSIKEGKN